MTDRNLHIFGSFFFFFFAKILYYTNSIQLPAGIVPRVTWAQLLLEPSLAQEDLSLARL